MDTFVYQEIHSFTAILMAALYFIVSLYHILSFTWPHHAACRTLVPRPGIELGPTAVKALSPNHWTAREFPRLYHILFNEFPPAGHLGCF